MNIFYKTVYLLIILLISVSGFSACSSDEPLDKAEKERLILIYAVAANNLQYNLKYDMQEILDIAPKLNLANNKVLVYSVVNSGECILQELRKNKSGKYEFVTVMTFPELPLSTSGERIAEVMEAVVAKYDYPYKGLVLWSHADGWLPWGQSTPDFPDGDNEKRKSFGWDNYQGQTYKTNITTLAEAIPAGTFDFIWFDCCYMANIETIYQLRDKTDYVVASVLEIAQDGMPYQLTMPYLLQKTPDLKSAAFEFYSYYDSHYIAVSVSITDTSQLEYLAEVTKSVFRLGTPPTALSNIQTYQRSLSEKFYDMGQLLRSYTNVDSQLEDALNDAFSNAVTYKLISDFDFNNKPINTRDYSGLSMHHYINSGSPNETFYQTLDWFMATR